MVKTKIVQITIIVMMFLFLPTSLWSQSISELSDVDQTRVAEAFENAQKEFELKHFNRAIASLEKAYAILPEPDILHRIGVSYERLKEYSVANLYYRRYLALRPDASDVDQVKEQIRRNELELKTKDPVAVKLFEIRVITNPLGAEILLDGVPKGKSPLVIKAQEGRHLVEASSPDYFQGSSFVNIDTKNIEVVINLKENVEPASRPLWPWIAMGAGGTSIAISAVSFWISDADQTKVDQYETERIKKQKAGEEAFRPKDQDRLAQRATIANGVGIGTGIAGLVLFSVGVIGLYTTGPSTEQSSFHFSGNSVSVSF